VKKITYLTSAHARYDTRIFIKMCSSLTAHGYPVSLVVADGLGDEVKNGVSIVDVGAKTGGRLSRMTKTAKRVYKKALEIDADIYHFHDPELIPIGLKLKKKGKIVIMDSHEDLPKQIMGKSYLKPFIRSFVSKVFEIYEKVVCGKFDAIVAATPHIRDKFLTINSNTVDVCNFPVLNEFMSIEPSKGKVNECAYIGSLDVARGINEIVEAMEYTDSIRLNLGGQFKDPKLEKGVKNKPSWSLVNELGFLNREQIVDIFQRSRVGLVTLHALPNYIDALPVKLFEYMSAGLPVIASNIPLWQEIVKDADCGLCVDPLSPKDIGEAIMYLMDNPEEAIQMGMNGRKAVEAKYNWGIEEQKLFDLYAKLSVSLK